MNVNTKHEEAHRALELLEEYHKQIRIPENKELQLALEKAIRTFKKNLFHALLELQEYYEETLLSDVKSIEEKTEETFKLIAEWDCKLNEEEFATALVNHSITDVQLSDDTKQYSQTLPHSSSLSVLPVAASSGTTNSMPRQMPKAFPSPALSQSSIPNSFTQPIGTVSNNMVSLTATTNGRNGSSTNGSAGGGGLGFSIAGGKDNPHIGNDPSIYITKVIEGGAAARDGRMKLGDIIVSVNDASTENVAHSIAVEALKRAGNRVQLMVRRPKVQGETLIEILLIKGSKGLGFSIAGGRGNQHIPGDDGIFITKIIDGGAAEQEGQLAVGDRLVSVNGSSLEGVTHEEAVAVLKASKERVRLIISKPAYNSLDVLDNGIPIPNNSNPPEIISNVKPLPASLPPRDSPASKPPVAPKQVEMPSVPPQNKPPTAPRPVETPSIPPPVSVTTATKVNAQPTTAQLGRVPSVPKIVEPAATHQQPYATIKGITQITDTSKPVARDPRRIVLKKGLSGLGFNIVGGEDGEGIFVSFILAGGSADLSGELRKGDQLLSVNNIDLTMATHEKAATVLKNSSDTVEIVVVHRPDEYARFEAKINNRRENMISLNMGSLRTTQKKSMFVRALFDYDSSKDSGLPSRGLSFHYGDILHVTNASDEEWWQARKMYPDGPEDEGLGIIPSKKRVEKKERSRLRNVKFPAKPDTKAATMEREKKKKGMGKKFSFAKNKDSSRTEVTVSNDDLLSLSTSRINSVSEETLPPISSYELIIQQDLKYTRPVLILGPLKDKINDDLIAEFPRKFSNCVPHTSRERRDHEVHGRDYYFTTRPQMEADIQAHLFIEAGQYNGNLYGTSLAAVREVAESNRHCILDVSGHAVKRLQAGNIFPIVVFTSPQSPQAIVRWLQVDSDTANRQYEKAYKLEQEFGEYFTATVTGETAEEVYSRVKEVIYQQSSSVIWIPSKDKL